MTQFEELFSTMKFVNDKEKKKIETLFEEYLKDLPENFYKNQFDLAKTYTGSDYQEWVKILTHPSFDNWKARQIALISATTTDRALADGDKLSDRESLNLLRARTDILKSENKNEKPIIIVMPESLFMKEED